MEKDTDTYLVKIHRGAASTIKFIGSKEDCDREAAQMNEQYQTDEYYVEKFDPEKFAPFVAMLDKFTSA